MIAVLFSLFKCREKDTGIYCPFYSFSMFFGYFFLLSCSRWKNRNSIDAVLRIIHLNGTECSLMSKILQIKIFMPFCRLILQQTLLLFLCHARRMKIASHKIAPIYNAVFKGKKCLHNVECRIAFKNLNIKCLHDCNQYEKEQQEEES